MSTASDPATVEKCLRLGRGFAADERPDIVQLFRKLDSHLAGDPADTVVLELHQKDPDQRGSKITLECQVTGVPMLVATSEKENRREALQEVRDDLVRQLEARKTKRLSEFRP